MSIIHKITGAILKPGLTFLGKRRLAKHNGIIEITGLEGKVEIRRDAQGVPHIYAKSKRDLFFAQGFCHAQDRLWQMELNRRVSQGRLSEIFGEAALDTDRLSRTFGFHRLADKDLESISEELNQIVEAYAEGVNAFLQHEKTKLPIEFMLARFKPEPWTKQDVAAFTRLMTLQLSTGWAHELITYKLMQGLEPEKAKELRLNYPDGNPTTLPQGIEANLFAEDGKLRAFNGPFMEQIKGSNSWAITGNKTDTGMPYLCSDPHLRLGLPGIWYQNYLEGGDLRVSGVSIPGMPLVMIGHNASISWGITLAYTDIQDLFVEKFKDGSREEYEFKGEWKETESIVEEIRIKGKKETHKEKITYTHHGPVITNVIETSGQQLSFSSAALAVSKNTMGWHGMNVANNWNDFVNAMTFVEAPGLNIVYADIHGNIGYWVTGKAPIRQQGDGSLPAKGWTGAEEWIGTVPFEEMPHCLNPEKGYVISCNHKIVDEDYPHYLGRTWMNGYRASRLQDLFDQKEKFKMEDFPAMHMDFLCKPGLEFALLYKGIKHSEGKVNTAINQLRDWDGQLTADSVAGTLYEVCKRSMLEILLEGSIGSEGIDYFTGKGPDPLLFPFCERLGHDTPTLFRMFNNPDSVWIKEAGGKEKVLISSMKRAVDWLSERFGPEMKDWRWGRLHKVTFAHPMAVKKPMDYVFNLGPVEIGGDTDTVCQTAYQPQNPYEAAVACPSYRQIVDMSDLSRSVWVMPPGSSGQIGSAHYGDQVEKWLEGKYFPMLWEREQVVKGTKALLTLEPK